MLKVIILFIYLFPTNRLIRDYDINKITEIGNFQTGRYVEVRVNNRILNLSSYHLEYCLIIIFNRSIKLSCKNIGAK